MDRAPAKIRKTEETKSDGQKIETLSNDEAKVVKKIGADGKVSSLKITTNDTVNDPIDGNPLGSPEQGAPQRQLSAIAYSQTPPPPSAYSQGPAQFQAPRRDWASMDWTPVRKLTDDIYGSNIAQGSTDPYPAIYKRAFEEFKLNNPGAGKGGKDSTLAWAKFNLSNKRFKDKLQYEKDRDIEQDLIKADAVKERKRVGDRNYGLQERIHKKSRGKSAKSSRLQDLNIRSKELGITAKEASIRKASEGTGVQQKAAGAARTLSLNAINARAALAAGKADESFDPTSHKEFWNYRSAWNGPTKSDAAKRYQSSSKAWTQERTRQVSGAVIRKDELIEETERFWPKPGDTDDIVADKIKQRRTQEENYWTIGYGSNTELNPNAARNTQDVAARMREYDEAVGLRPSTRKKTSKQKELDKIDAEIAADEKRLKELRK